MGTKVSANALTLGRSVCSARPLDPPLHEFLAQPVYRIRPFRPSSFGPAKQLEPNRAAWSSRIVQLNQHRAVRPVERNRLALFGRTVQTVQTGRTSPFGLVNTKSLNLVGTKPPSPADAEPISLIESNHSTWLSQTIRLGYSTWISHAAYSSSLPASIFA